jgi:glutamine amidotransferase
LGVELALVDYGVGNIHSIQKCFERAGASVSVETHPERILKAHGVILPGVGAFGKVASQIAPFREELKARFEAGMPAFAVCIGMQVLYESSEEGEGRGIGLFPGRVRRLPHPRLPHIGWNSVHHDGRGVLEGIPPAAHFYFVHSFAPEGAAAGAVATCDYGGRFAAASAGRHVWATQFHPEKSSDVGFQVVRNFVRFASEVA